MLAWNPGVRLYGTVVVLSALLTGCLGAPPDEGTARFASFEVSPTTVCANTGTPLLRVRWDVEGNRRSQIALTINDRGLPPGPASPGPLAGDGDWSGEENIDLRAFFAADGETIPSQLRIEGRLSGSSPSASPFGGLVRLDTESRSVTARNDCP
jgi:hypothetical protein